MDESLVQDAARILREAGARFAYRFGSSAQGTAGPRSDVDIAAWFGREVDPIAVAARLPGRVALLALDDAPLATTRRIWLDERYRVDRARRLRGRSERTCSTSMTTVW